MYTYKFFAMFGILSVVTAAAIPKPAPEGVYRSGVISALDIHERAALLNVGLNVGTEPVPAPPAAPGLPVDPSLPAAPGLPVDPSLPAAPGLPVDPSLPAAPGLPVDPALPVGP
ncbi:hypothetical protein EV426DRAFT_711723 [Tirmania nivea]|nr:hypothetical protein EV426DRAFT_711723 [Tirmania nivea]